MENIQLLESLVQKEEAKSIEDLLNGNSDSVSWFWNPISSDINTDLEIHLSNPNFQNSNSSVTNFGKYQKGNLY
jgi:hypothetical protein